MPDIISLYNDSAYNNLKIIDKIINSDIGLNDPYLMELFNKTLQTSKNELIEKWRSGKKYLRTLTVIKAFPDYSLDSLNLSISIDAIINILDDLLDENLEKQAKTFYIVEIIRTLANYHYQKSNKALRHCIGNYFNKCIMIALLEKHFYDLLRNTKENDYILKYPTYIYDIRSLDIDVFIEIPLLASNTIQFKDDIIKVARTYRALELIKKDILDVEHDVDNGIDTIFTILWNRKNDLLKSVNNLIELYLNRAGKIKCSKHSNIVIDNFILMSENEVNNIRKYTKKYIM